MFKKLLIAVAITGLSSLSMAQGVGAAKHPGSATPATPATPAVHAAPGTPATPAVAATPAMPASQAAHDDMAAKPKAKHHKKQKREHKK